MKRTNVLLASGLATVVLSLASVNSFATNDVNATATRSGTDTRSVKVSYSELDITKPAGAQALYKRIRKAAFAVCGAYDSPMPWYYTARSQCFKTAVDDAVGKVNSPLLTSLHNNENTRLASK